MAGYRFWLQCSLAIVAALTIVQIGRSQPPPPTDFGPKLYKELFNKGVVNNDADLAEKSCVKVYSLADLGDDPKLCAWIAETIPQMIEPGSWKNGKSKLSY